LIASWRRTGERHLYPDGALAQRTACFGDLRGDRKREWRADLGAWHEDIVWRTIGHGSWSRGFVGKQTIIDEIFRPLNRVLVERATIPTRIDGGEVIVVQAAGRNLTSDGQRYDNDYAFVGHFRDGKIARYEEYCDTELIARVLPDRIAAKSISKPA
jgi:uncharacterized protein